MLYDTLGDLPLCNDSRSETLKAILRLIIMLYQNLLWEL